MPIAFVISRDEAQVVSQVVPAGASSPSMNGCLFSFAPSELKPMIANLGAFISKATNSDEANAAQRLSDRLATWYGKNVAPRELAASKAAQPAPVPVEHVFNAPEPAPVEVPSPAPAPEPEHVEPAPAPEPEHVEPVAEEHHA